MAVSRITRIRLAVLGAAVCLGVGVPIVQAAPWRWRTVHVTVAGHGGASYRVRARTVEQALRVVGIPVGPHDRVEPALSTRLENNMTVTVARAVRLRVRADGRDHDVWTTEPTVGQALAAIGIAVGPKDRVEPSPDTHLFLGPQGPVREVRVVRVREEDTTRLVELPFGTEKHQDASLPAGQVREVRAGKPGLREVTVRTRYEDGKPVARTVVAERVVRAPVDRVLSVGTAGVVYRGGEPLRYRRMLRMEATAYSPGDGHTPDAYTATGRRAGRGVVAVDPRVIPLGTRLYIDGYGPAVAGDVGGAIRGNRIDLGFDSVSEARAFGRRPVTVYVLFD